MLPLLVTMACWAGAGPGKSVPTDTLHVLALAEAPVLDGRIGATEYGAAPVLTIATAAGEVRIRVARHAGQLHVAAELPDATFYWGDDLVISLDPDGSGGAGPGPGDRQWYLRRSLDSSHVHVVTGTDGRWFGADEQPSALGVRRSGDDWEVASTSTDSAWCVELRIAASAITAEHPRIAFRTFNDEPQGWWSWPAAPEGRAGHHVERVPDLWPVVRFR